LLPALGVFLIFEHYPLLRVIYLSFSEADLLKSPSFVGLSNYQEMFRNREFLGSLFVTAVFALVVTALEVGLGMALAFLMNTESRFQSLVRGAIFAPVVISVTAAALIWAYMLNPNGGPVNQVLESLGFSPLRWLQHPDRCHHADGLLHLSECLSVFQDGLRQCGFGVLVWSVGLLGLGAV
jgi:ABC-type sugar transport system permease subunit